MKVRLTILSAVEVAGLASTLIYFLYRIVTSMEHIGELGESYLARIQFGVRAIEKETSPLGPQVALLNQQLGTLAGEMNSIGGNLRSVAHALRKGGKT